MTNNVNHCFPFEAEVSNYYSAGKFDFAITGGTIGKILTFTAATNYTSANYASGTGFGFSAIGIIGSDQQCGGS